MRLDKFLCEMNIGTRSRIKSFVRQGLVTVNGMPVRSADCRVNELSDRICFRGQHVPYCRYVYYMMNKPEGVVSATQDNTAPTVLSLLGPDRRGDIFPVGRLDKDTTGLLLLTNDGELAHNLLAPGKHVEKTYQVIVGHPLTQEDILRLEQGVDIGEEKRTLPARVSVPADDRILLTLHEGKYHQVKRMLQAVGNRVLSLKRISFGGLELDGELSPGEYRALGPEEVDRLRTVSQKGRPVEGKDQLKRQRLREGQSEKGAAKRQRQSERAFGRREQMRHEMLQGIEAVIFDLDGSLVDSMWIWRAIDIEYLNRFGISLPEDLQSKIEGMSFMETAVYFKKQFQIPDSLEQIKADWNRMAWDKYMHEVPLKKGISEFLKKCVENGIKLGIATSNSRELMENIAAVHSLRDYFTCILTGSEIQRGKPAPDIYLAVADRLQVSPSHCLVFEDIVPGILSGKSAGMRVCAVEDAYSVHDREKKRRLADYYIEDYVGLFP